MLALLPPALALALHLVLEAFSNFHAHFMVGLDPTVEGSACLQALAEGAQQCDFVLKRQREERHSSAECTQRIAHGIARDCQQRRVFFEQQADRRGIRCHSDEVGGRRECSEQGVRRG